jgi:pimeloyl-ACP methyl ester carboxylesterase
MPHRWDIPILVAWGKLDKYLRQSEAETFQKNNVSTIIVDMLEGAGHMPQEDW